MNAINPLRCVQGHTYRTPGRVAGDLCPSCALKGQYVGLSVVADHAVTSEDFEVLVQPVLAIDVEAVPALELDGFFGKLVGALNGIRSRTVYLTYGDPGVGKSTLLAQIAGVLPAGALYVSAEEPREAIAERAKRLHVRFPDRFFVFEGGDCSILETTLGHEEMAGVGLIVIDSIQTMFTPDLDTGPGSVSQVVACTNIMKRWAREHDVAIWMLAHVTKDSTVAGPKALEHLVDVVTEFREAERVTMRELVIHKNRRGRLAGPVLFDAQRSGAWIER